MKKYDRKRVNYCCKIGTIVCILTLLSGLSALESGGFSKKIKLRGAYSLSRLENMSSTQLHAQIPKLLYGTAWKKEKTAELVLLAVRSGFRGIDTACQPKHYNERGVGIALAKLFEEGTVSREEIFIQTKFTSLDGQDPQNISYDQYSSLEEQVRQSFRKSCENLGINYIDSFVLHSPLQSFMDTMRVWRIMEEFYLNGSVKHLGISNTYDVEFFKRLYESAIVKPTFIQNRFYSRSGYDVQIREFCQLHRITYQSFWTLTANPHILSRYRLNNEIKISIRLGPS